MCVAGRRSRGLNYRKHVCHTQLVLSILPTSSSLRHNKIHHIFSGVKQVKHAAGKEASNYWVRDLLLMRA